MPVTIWERVDSRRMDISLENPSIEFDYMILGAADENAARTAVESTISATYVDALGNTLPFEHYSLAPMGNTIWTVTSRYSLKRQKGQNPSPEAGEKNTVNFEIGVEQVKLTQSLETINSYAVTGTPPDCKGAIGVNGDTVEGVEIEKPTMSFSETWYVDPATITTPFLNALRDLGDAPVNNAPFRGFNTGEVRYRGGTGTQRDKGNFELTFRFAVSPNKSSLTIGDMSGIQKDGWDYLWVMYKDVEDQGRLIQQPAFAYVERVYDRSSFSVLGIGS